MLDQQLDEDPDFSRGVLSWRPDDEYAGRGDRIACHHRDQGAGSQMVLGEAIRKPGDAEPRYSGGGESGAVVRLEPPLRMNGDRLVAVMNCQVSVPCMSASCVKSSSGVSGAPCSLI